MIFSRRPAVWVGLAAAILSLLVALGVPGVDDVTAPLILAAINAAATLAVAAMVRPFAPSALTGLVTALGALAAGYGANIPPDVLAAINAVLVASLAAWSNAATTPAPALARQPSGPVPPRHARGPHPVADGSVLTTDD